MPGGRPCLGQGSHLREAPASAGVGRSCRQARTMKMAILFSPGSNGAFRLTCPCILSSYAMRYLSSVVPLEGTKDGCPMRSMLYALCAMPYALCPMRYALCAMITAAFNHLFEQAGTVRHGQSEGTNEVIKRKKRIRERNRLPVPNRWG